MNEKWHIVALAVCVSICTKVFATYAFMIVYLIWLVWLFRANRLNQLHVVLSIVFFVITFTIIPSLDNTSGNDSFKNNEYITGKIIQPLERKERVIESVIREEETKTRILLTYFPKDSQETPHIEIPHGASCKVFGKVDVVNPARNPGEFDFNYYLQSQDISYQIIVSNLSDIFCTDHSLLHYVHQIRQKILIYINNELDPVVGSWIRTLILGDSSAIDSNIIELFQEWGLSHILAISGLHVGLIVGLLYALLVKSGWLTKETASYILMGFIPFYIVIAGAQPSVLRAGLMVFLFLVLQAWFRKISTTDGLSIIFIFLVWVDPFIIYQIGFQFSFITTFALLLSRKWFSQTSSPFWNIAQISFIAQMAILPLQLNAFHLFQPLSIILNILVVTYFSVIVIPFLLVYALSFPLLSVISKLFDRIFIYIHTSVIEFIFYVDQVGFPRIVIGSFPIIASVTYYGFFFWMMLNLENRQLKRSFLAGALLVFTLVCIQLFPYVSKEGRVTMLDIGQGDAIVIELPYRKGVFMVDAGATFSFKDQAVSDKEFKHIIKPFLYSRGIQKIDALLISHEHLDHNGSVPDVVKEFDVDHFIISDYYELNKEEEFLIRQEEVALHRLRAFDEFKIMNQSFTVVSPNQDDNDENENSLTVITKLGGENWIFTGDIYKKQELMIQQNFPDLQIDIWKVAHHGSDTSSARETISHYNPKVFLIPVGVNNSHGHPNKEVIDILIETGGKIFRTDQDGAIEYRFKEDIGTFSPFLQTIPVHRVGLLK